MGEGKGKFDDLSHFQLDAMAKEAKPNHLVDVGTALTFASQDIDDLADEMLAHAERVKWEGKGGDAFRTWVEAMSKETRKLGNYAGKVGFNLSEAAYGLTTVQSAMPEAPDKCYVKESAAQKKARLDAVKQIETLDSYYGVAHSNIEALKGQEPNFPPLPGGLIDSYEGGETPIGSPPSVRAASAGTGIAGAAPLSAADRTAVGTKAAPIHPAEVSPHTPVTPNGGSVIPGVGVPDPTNTAIDSVEAPPAQDTINRPSTPPGPQDAPNVPSNGPKMPPIIGLPGPRPIIPTVPPVGRTAPIPGPGQLGKLPPTAPSTPRTSSLPPRIPTNDGIVGGKRNVGPTNAPRIPRGMVVGEEPHAPMARGPIGPGGHFLHGPTPTTASGSGRRLVSEPGGMVDRPKGTNPPGRSLPRSTVVGEERGVVPRGPLGAGVHPVDGGVHTPGGTGTGRRLTSEPGGVTGGPRVPREGRSEFTQGGSGLVRGNHGPAVAPHSSALPHENRRNAGARPDYLEEDEETWSGGRRNTVPPVIE
jgi:hypothetical protein